MAAKEQQHPFYKPLHRRVIIVAVCAAWLGFELWMGKDELFKLFSAGALAYAVYTFFITWPKDAAPAEDLPRDEAGPPAV